MADLVLAGVAPKFRRVKNAAVQDTVTTRTKSVLAVKDAIYRTYEDYNPEDLYLYAGFDCIVTSELLAKLVPTCVAEPKYIKSVAGKREETTAMSIFESYDKYTTPSFEFIVDLELNGIKYDIEGNKVMGQRMLAEVRELERQIFEAIGETIDLDSGDVMVKFLYETKGFEVEARTKTGEPSTDGEALSALAVKYDLPWLKLIAKRKDIVSVYRTFIENYVADFVKADGRLHPVYNLHGTSSFRISGENPNLPAVPRPKHGYNVRELYVPSEGFVFIAADFSSAEVKVLGAISKDPMLLKAIAEGLDFHSFSASQMRGIPYGEFIRVLEDDTNPLRKEYKELRQRAKVLTFSILYGSTANGIARQLGISVKEAEALMDLYFSKFPGIREYIDDRHNEAKWNHYVVDPEFGQRKMLYGTYSCFEDTAIFNASLRNASNVRIQGPTSSLGLATFSACNPEIKKLGGRCLFSVYDSLELEVPIPVAAQAIETVFYYFHDWPLKNFEFLALPIGEECEISGKSWGHVKKVHRGITQAEVEAMLAKERALFP